MAHRQIKTTISIIWSIVPALQASILPMPMVLARENSDRSRENRGLFLIYRSQQNPDMYDLLCRNAEQRRELLAIVREALRSPPPANGYVPLSLPRVLLDSNPALSLSHSSLSHAAAGMELKLAAACTILVHHS